MKKYKYLLLFCFALFFSCLKEELLESKADFSFSETSIPNGKKVTFQNLSTNAEQFTWTFENGTPANSNKFDPGEVIFTTPGIHKIKLVVNNKDGSKSEIEKEINVTTTASTDFSYEILINNYAPAEVRLTNLSQNVTQNNWTFSTGIPATSNLQNPTNVFFNSPGQQSITLQTNQGQKVITFDVLPTLNVDFNIIVPPIDDDYKAPIKIKTQNNTISATSYQWEVVGATPSSSTAQNPEFLFSSAGTYQVKLIATNGKQTLSLIKSITVLPYSNLSIQNDVKFGINTAHASLGSFYSTLNKAIYRNADVNATNGSAIDLVFFGLNNSFSNNVFLSPNNVSTFGFQSIPNATNTTYINKQESCGCINITSAQFDAMTDDTLLQNYTVVAQNSNFNTTVLPRIIPFITQDGRKGLIKIKTYTDNGLNSFIMTDIKVQKH
jgi:PKD repeat protein